MNNDIPVKKLKEFLTDNDLKILIKYIQDSIKKGIDDKKDRS